MMRIALTILTLLSASLAFAQAPGSVFDSAIPATNPLDPNGDRFITVSGAAFTGPLDASEFEIPYLPIIQYEPEPAGDNTSGTGCDAFDLISDAPGNAAAAYYYYQDPDGIRDNGDELILLRLRLARRSNGSTGFSVLFDTDYKFGFSGSEADPNAVAGNPGFEREILASNSPGGNGGVKTLDVDGRADASAVVYNASIHSNYQESFALNQDPACSSRAPAFVDLYVPFSTLGITPTTQVRMAVAVNEAPETSLGGGASDIGGVNGDVITDNDDQFIAAILNHSPIAFEVPPNIAPIVTDATLSLDENTANATLVHTVSGTDSNGDVLAYSITAGNTGDAFAIDAATGLLTVNNALALDAETNPVFTLVVKVSDGTLYNNSIVTINLNDLNEASPVASDAVVSVSENTAAGGVIHTAAVTDPDAAPVFTFSIVGGNSSGAFAINSATGAISVSNSAPLNFETSPSFVLTVLVSDGIYSDAAAITINLTDVNDPPAANDATLLIDENTPNGTPVGQVTATDEDAMSSYSYSIVSGNTGSAFAIDAVSGAITVNNSTALDFETSPVFNLTVRIGDGGLNDDAAITINLNDVNDPPSISNSIFSVTENSSNGSTAGTVIASDPDAVAMLTYSIIGGNTGAAFAINSATGEISVSNGSLLDYEYMPVFSLTVRVSDGAAAVDGTITINLNDVNEEPPVATDASVSLDENAATGTAVHTVTATDPDIGAVLSYSMVSGNTAGAFVINPDTGEITVDNTGPLDYETAPAFSLTVRVSDGSNFDDAIITVQLNDINDAPVLADAAVSVSEHSAAGTLVHTAMAADQDAAAVLNYSIISGNTGAAFAINSSTGAITVADPGALDYETVPVFALTIRASDGLLSQDAAVNVTLNDINDHAPSGIDASIVLNENSSNGTLVHTVTATDADATDVMTYSITAGNTGAAFAINGVTGAITVNDVSVLDVETITVFSLTVQVNDGTFQDDVTITINLNDVNEHTPVANDATVLLNEHSANGTVVHSMMATDADASAVLTYSILSGNTGNAFVIDGSNGVITVNDSDDINYEMNPTFILTIRVSDGVYSGDADITINLTDSNDPPSAADAAVAVDENSPNGTLIHTVGASDANGDPLTFAITSGNTAAAFAINSSSGAITVNDFSQLDAEATPAFLLVVRVSDGMADTDVSITINLNDLNEQPLVAGDATMSINENATAGTVAGSVSATDPDASSVLSYSITAGNTASAFAINSSSGEITVSNAAALDYESVQSYSLTVQVSDGTFADNAIITVSLNDVNEPPAIADAWATVDENPIAGSVVYTVAGADPDASALLTYSIISGNPDQAFSINSNTGTITVNNTNALDFETAASLIITVRVDDGNYTADADVTISLNDVNEKPLLPDMVLKLDENTPNPFVLDTLEGLDPDAGAVLTYSITAGNTLSAISLQSNTGEISVNNPAAIDFEANPFFNLTINVSDGTLSHDALLTIRLNDLSEAPSVANATVTLDEHAPAGTTLHTVTGTDPDAGTMLTYDIIKGNTGDAFTIDNNSGTITVNDPAAADFELTPSFALTVRVSDGGLFDDALITVNLNNVNEPPSLADASASIDEHTAAGGTVVILSATDIDAGDALTYAIISGNTAAAFAINAATGEISVNDPTGLDFESNSLFNLIVRVSDGALSEDASVTITLNEVNEAPSGVDGSVLLDENSITGATVHTVAAADPDANDATDYSIISGNTNLAFAIDPVTGEIIVSDQNVLDFETSPVYTLTVRVSDGSLYDDATITVNLNDVNEAPACGSASVLLEEHPVNGAFVHAVSASDPDEGAVLSYTITNGDPGAAFTIDKNTGAIFVNDASVLDFENSAAISLTITISDGTLTADAVVDIALSNINEAPTVAGGSATLDEYSPNGYLVHTMSASDPEGDVVSYSIIGGNADGIFALDSNTGEIRVNDYTALDFESTPVFILSIRATDGTLAAEAEVIITLNNMNEAPVVEGASIELAAPFADQDAIYTVMATDPDAGDVLTYTITGGNTNDVFAIDPANGQLIVQTTANLSAETLVFDLQITVTDKGGLSASAIVSVSVTPVAERNGIDPEKGFSPNGDGNNDFWLIKGIEAFPDNVIQVFNRWGTPVYETRGYNNETNVWRGEIARGPAPDVESTYFFIIRTLDSDPVTGYVIVKP